MGPQKEETGTSLAVQQLRLHASNVGGAGLIPGQGTKIPHAVAKKKFFKGWMFGNFLMGQWLGLCASTAGNMGSITSWGIKKNR